MEQLNTIYITKIKEKNKMKKITMILGFCLEVGCFTAILNQYDWKAFLLAMGAALGSGIVSVMQIID